MQKPLSLPIVSPRPPNCVAQPLQNLHMEMTSNALSGWYELIFHQAVDGKEFREHFDCLRNLMLRGNYSVHKDVFVRRNTTC